MEIIECQQCQKDFDGGLQVCPHCGAPYGARGGDYPRLPGWAFMAIIVLFVALILLFMYSMLSM